MGEDILGGDSIILVYSHERIVIVRKWESLNWRKCNLFTRETYI